MEQSISGIQPTVRKNRPTLENLRRNLWIGELTSRVPKKQKDVAVSILRLTGRYDGMLAKIDACNKRHPCNIKWCPKCSDPKRRKKGKHHIRDVDRFLNKDYRATDGAVSSSNYQVSAGNRMVGAFEGIPPILVHGVTIDLTLVPVTGNLEQEARWWRRRVRRALGKVLTKGAIARGKLDIALKYADELSFELPDSDLPRELQGQDAPHTRYAMLHIHFGCFDPWLSRSELTKRLSKEFPGKKRVCVRASHDDFELADGTIVPGIKGYLEYMSLEKVELDFGEDSIEAVVEFADIDGTWKRANRDIRYGDRPDSICDLIDDSRVRYLEAERLRQKHKKNWKNMGFAEQFLHKWMTNAVDVYNQVMSGDGVSIAPNSQGSVPNLICNWTLGIVSQATDRARKYIKRSVKTFGKPLRDGCKPVITGSIRP